MGRDSDADVGPRFDLAEVVEADFGDLLPDARTDIRIGEAFQHRRNAAFMQPGRQQEAQRVRGPIIGILVAVHVDAARAGGVDRLEKAIGLAPAVGPGQLHVGDLHMDAAMLADVDCFGDGLLNAMGFVADVGGVACAVGLQYAA